MHKDSKTLLNADFLFSILVASSDFGSIRASQLPPPQSWSRDSASAGKAVQQATPEAPPHCSALLAGSLLVTDLTTADGKDVSGLWQEIDILLRGPDLTALGHLSYPICGMNCSHPCSPSHLCTKRGAWRRGRICRE